eukprot:TRINITY_DN2858_c1_g1_i1.p1 TRINITY_DN2858_c1_g1~~TRINITY_DN2858_c1_g1_i1.p1  ORF type:complete len:335 (-),score=51.90 TRINITY_DN2858_c1_g1_i1:32-1036(-)
MQLSDDAWATIFTYSSDEDLVQFPRMCRQWHAVLNEDWFWELRYHLRTTTLTRRLAEHETWKQAYFADRCLFGIISDCSYDAQVISERSICEDNDFRASVTYTLADCNAINWDKLRVASFSFVNGHSHWFIWESCVPQIRRHVAAGRGVLLSTLAHTDYPVELLHDIAPMMPHYGFQLAFKFPYTVPDPSHEIFSGVDLSNTDLVTDIPKGRCARSTASIVHPDAIVLAWYSDCAEPLLAVRTVGTARIVVVNALLSHLPKRMLSNIVTWIRAAPPVVPYPQYMTPVPPPPPPPAAVTPVDDMESVSGTVVGDVLMTEASLLLEQDTDQSAGQH